MGRQFEGRKATAKSCAKADGWTLGGRLDPLNTESNDMENRGQGEGDERCDYGFRMCQNGLVEGNCGS